MFCSGLRLRDWLLGPGGVWGPSFSWTGWEVQNDKHVKYCNLGGVVNYNLYDD